MKALVAKGREEGEWIPPEILRAGAWDPRTAEWAYEASRSTRETPSAWADSLDTKLVAVFGVGSVLLTLVPTLEKAATPATTRCWLVARVFWLIPLGFAYYGYRRGCLGEGHRLVNFSTPSGSDSRPMSGIYNSRGCLRKPSNATVQLSSVRHWPSAGP